MIKPRLSLQSFAAAIAQSVTKANEMLETDHKIAVQRFRSDQFGTIMPPPPPLMIQNVKVKFRCNLTKNEHDRDSDELFVDLNRPDGNFSAEMEFIPFDEELLRVVKRDGGANIPFAAKPSRRLVTPRPVEKESADVPEDPTINDIENVPDTETETEPEMNNNRRRHESRYDDGRGAGNTRFRPNSRYDDGNDMGDARQRPEPEYEDGRDMSNTSRNYNVDI